MEVSVSDAKGQLTELVRLAEAGEEIELTRHGRAVVRLVPIAPRPNRAARSALLRGILAEARKTPPTGVDAARSQDFLYGEDGLPG